MQYDISTLAPLPWKHASGADFILKDKTGADVLSCYGGASEARKRAAFVKRCVNTHDEMIAILERVAAHFEGTDAPLGIDARAALARARGES